MYGGGVRADEELTATSWLHPPPTPNRSFVNHGLRLENATVSSFQLPLDVYFGHITTKVARLSSDWSLSSQGSLHSPDTYLYMRIPAHPGRRGREPADWDGLFVTRVPLSIKRVDFSTCNSRVLVVEGSSDISRHFEYKPRVSDKHRAICVSGTGADITHIWQPCFLQTDPVSVETIPRRCAAHIC